MGGKRRKGEKVGRRGSMVCYVFDIEGTVCPISFVKETLFPFFEARIDDVAGDPAVLEQFPGVQDLGAELRRMVAADVKDARLKQLQGQVWEAGYRDGEITAPVYADAVDLFHRIKQDPAARCYIYSSGSVRAQKLLFAHVQGPQDLTPCIDGYFDITTSGPKTQPSSYENILQKIAAAEQEQVWFFSDNAAELDAALQTQRIKTVLVRRAGNAPVDPQRCERYALVLDDLTTVHY